MATYSQIKTALDEISSRIMQERSRLMNAKASITQAKAALGNLETQYGGIVVDIDAAATDNPNNEAYQQAKAEKDLLVTEFNALKSTATAMETDLSDDTP